MNKEIIYEEFFDAISETLEYGGKGMTKRYILVILMDCVV